MKTDLARRALLLGAASLFAGCSSSPIPPVRFANAPPAFVVDDRRDVPKPPKEREFLRDGQLIDANFYKPADRAMALPTPRRALGVNALDEVPDSTWFTNRIGVRDLTPEEVRIGPATVGSPEAHRPWTVTKTKQGGRAIGIIVKDARGEEFIVKFDPKGVPEMESGADAIVSRLLWAVGYNVPEDHVAHIKRSDLVIAKDAVISANGKKRPLDAEALDATLARAHVEPDGTYRVIASRMIQGVPLGGHASEGVRADDPNDRIRHERRRDLRGMQTFFAWLDHNDVKEDNTLDMWVADAADKQRHYVKHYLVDFGKALGGSAFDAGDPRPSYSYRYDYSDAFMSLVTLGMSERGWEERTGPGLRGLGLIDSKTYDPGGWKAVTPVYTPFITADRFDKFWAAKILIRFTRAHLLAAVETAQFSDPNAVEYMVNVLEQRQRKTAAHWFRRVSPLDDFTIEGDALCFTDLMLRHGLVTAGTSTEYRMRSHDREGNALADAVAFAPNGGQRGRVCTNALRMPAAGDGYTVVRLETLRENRKLVVFVHVARTQFARGPEVIGIWRQ